MSASRFWALMVILGSLLLSGGCKGGFPGIRSPRHGLVKRVELFNRYLRWTRYELAKQMVAPWMRSVYVERWERNRGKIKVTEMDVRDVAVARDKKRAVVLVVMKWYVLPSTILKRKVMAQRWRRIKGIWIFVGTGRKWPSRKAPAKGSGERGRAVDAGPRTT